MTEADADGTSTAGHREARAYRSRPAQFLHMFLVAVAFGAGCGVVLVNLEHPTFGKVVAVPLMLFAGLFLVGLALTTRRHS